MAKAIPAPVVFGGLSLILAREKGGCHRFRVKKVAVTVFGTGRLPGDSVDPGGRGISIRREQIHIFSAR
jgi:hypothetical protein